MDDKQARIRIKNKAIEIEIEGNENFVESQQMKLQELFSLITTLNTPRKSDNTAFVVEKDGTPREPTLDEILQSDFSEWKKRINSDTDDIVSYLFAGYFIQRRNKENYFTTPEAFSLLYKNGILLRDATFCETHNLEIKNISKVGTTKKWNKLRVDNEVITLANDILKPI